MDYTTHRIAIFAGIVFFTIAGLYGNISLIVLHIRKQKLRTKYGKSCVLTVPSNPRTFDAAEKSLKYDYPITYKPFIGLLISWLSFFQSLCLIFEWVGTIYTALYSPFVIRSVCLYLICVYVFVHCMQTGLLATIAVDLLISIVCPLTHRVSRNEVYVTIMSVPSIMYGLSSVALGFVLSNDDKISMCNPPSSLQKRANEFWYGVALAAGAVTVVSYLLAYFILRCRNNKHLDQQQELAKRSMRSLSIILLIFLLTRYTATIGANVMNMADANPDVVTLFQNYCVFMALVCYSQNFYVTIWRGSDYRRHLWHQQIRLYNAVFGKCCPVKNVRHVFITSQGFKSEHTSATPN